MKVIRNVSILLLVLALAAPALAKDLIFEITDPQGDDHGNGHLVYPLRSEYNQGELDLVALRARAVKGGTEFEAEFARPIRVPTREAVDDLGTQLSDLARYGFYNFNLDIYIDQDRVPGSGVVTMMPGRLAELSPDHAWERAIILTPQPNEARGALERRAVAAAHEAQKKDPVYRESDKRQLRKDIGVGIEEQVYFPNRVRVRGRLVRFFVPETFLRGTAQADWSYTVAVSGADLLQSLDLTASIHLADTTKDRLMILPVSPGTWQNRFGGGWEDEPLQPPLVDILVPRGEIQERVLGSFRSDNDQPALVPGVVPADEAGPALGGGKPGGR